MMIIEDARARIALLVSTIALSGCAVGTVYVSAPHRLPSKTLPPLTHPIRFDVCVSPQHGPAKEELGNRIREALSRAGVTAEHSAGGSPVDFTATVRDDSGPMWSMVVSLLTFSVVPGYYVQRKTLDVDLAWRDAAQAGKTERLHYQSSAHAFSWLPLIVAMDFIWAVADGWVSPRVEDAGFKQMVERLGDDIRARLGGDTAAAPVRGTGGVACPRTTAAAGPP